MLWSSSPAHAAPLWHHTEHSHHPFIPSQQIGAQITLVRPPFVTIDESTLRLISTYFILPEISCESHTDSANEHRSPRISWPIHQTECERDIASYERDVASNYDFAIEFCVDDRPFEYFLSYDWKPFEELIPPHDPSGPPSKIVLGVGTEDDMFRFTRDDMRRFTRDDSPYKMPDVLARVELECVILDGWDELKSHNRFRSSGHREGMRENIDFFLRGQSLTGVR